MPTSEESKAQGVTNAERYATKADELSRDGEGRELAWWTGLAALLRLQATTIAEQAGEIERRVWRLIDDAPADTDLLLGWWQEWPSRKWQTQVGFAHSTKGGWWHGQATHWMHLPEPADLLSELGERGE